MLKPKFEIGQKVLCVNVDWSEKKIKCPDCLGTKQWEVKTPAGETFQHDCNTCRAGWYSEGVVSEYADRARIRELTIGSIRIDTADLKSPISYMCIETGVGSGSVYDENTMFPNKTEADSYAERELERVKGLRNQEELDQRKHKKKDTIYKKAKK